MTMNIIRLVIDFTLTGSTVRHVTLRLGLTLFMIRSLMIRFIVILGTAESLGTDTVVGDLAFQQAIPTDSGMVIIIA